MNQIKVDSNKGRNRTHYNEWKKKDRHKKGISKKFNTPGPESEKPWHSTYRRIITRCKYDKKSSYYKRGVKCLITPEELRKIWFRDYAFNMKKPSIDRISGGLTPYTFENCRYVELEFNLNWKRRNKNGNND